METETEETKCFGNIEETLRTRELQKLRTETNRKGRKTIIHIDSDMTSKTIL